ncbi:uncharacterized protein isoform X2 [Rhodnius prolixus]|uniref:uncharacterized protein isoform X2 n=1 Tax=Rhodnius prolixus TaxID=13249 RepID=UPI003D18BD8E
MIRAKKYKPRKAPKMDLFRKRASDYSADNAYREAVTKLKYLLADSYTPVTVHKFTPGVLRGPHQLHHHHHHCTFDIPSTTIDKPTPLPQFEQAKQRSLQLLPKRPETSADTPPEFMSFMRRQEDYIEQLEKESHCCREEVANMLEKVREVMAENDRLRAEKKDYAVSTEEDNDSEELNDKGTKKKTSTFKTSGPNIVFESRISELEAQLTQCKLELRKAQDEAAFLKSQTKVTEPGQYANEATKQIEALQRERDELNETINHLQLLVNQLKDKEASATQKVKRSLDLIDQTHFDKNQLEMEVRRLKCELERMNDKQRESMQEAARRVTEAERRYTMQIERLNSDLAAQWDTANRLNLDLDRARRTEQELRRDLAQKNSVIDELKKELTTKTSNLQSEALTAGAERESLESELSACRLALERAERSARQETSRLQAEVASLRQRIDRADADLLHSRKENLRLSDNVASLEKELNLAKLAKESTPGTESKRGDDLATMIKEMDAKHVQSVAELEGMIQSQTQLMEKLKNECQNLTERLEDSSARHKQEMAGLQNNIEYLNSKLEAPINFENQEWRDDGMVGNYEQDTRDYERVEGNGGGQANDLNGYNGVMTSGENYIQNGQKDPYEDQYSLREQYRNNEIGYGKEPNYNNQNIYEQNQFNDQNGGYTEQAPNYGQQHGNYTDDQNDYSAAQSIKYNEQTSNNYVEDNQDYSTRPEEYSTQEPGSYHQQPESYPSQGEEYRDRYVSHPQETSANFNQQPGGNYTDGKDYVKQSDEYNPQSAGYKAQPTNYPSQARDYNVNQEGYGPQPNEQIKGPNGKYNQQNDKDYPAQNNEYAKQGSYAEQLNNYTNSGPEFRTEQEENISQPMEPIKRQAANYSPQPSGNYAPGRNGYSPQLKEYPVQSRNYAEQPNKYPQQAYDYRVEQEGYATQPDHYTSKQEKNAYNYPKQSINYQNQSGAYNPQSPESYIAQDNYGQRQQGGGYSEQPARYTPTARNYSPQNDSYSKHLPEYSSQQPGSYPEQNIEFRSAQPSSEHRTLPEYKSPEVLSKTLPNEQVIANRQHTPKDDLIHHDTNRQENELNPPILTSYSEPQEQNPSQAVESLAAETNDYSGQPKVMREEVSSDQAGSYQDQTDGSTMQTDEYEKLAQSEGPSDDQTGSTIQTEPSPKTETNFAVNPNEEESNLDPQPPDVKTENPETQQRTVEVVKSPDEHTQNYVPSPEPSDTRQSPPMKQLPSQLSKQQVPQPTKQTGPPIKQQGPTSTKQPSLTKQQAAPKQPPPQNRPPQTAKQQNPQTKQQPSSQSKSMPGQTKQPSVKQSAPSTK